MKAGREAEAMAVISALEDKPYTDPEVKKTYHAVQEAMTLEGAKPGVSEKVSLSELFTGGRSQNFRRVELSSFPRRLPSYHYGLGFVGSGYSVLPAGE